MNLLCEAGDDGLSCADAAPSTQAHRRVAGAGSEFDGELVGRWPVVDDKGAVAKSAVTFYANFIHSGFNELIRV